VGDEIAKNVAQAMAILASGNPIIKSTEMSAQCTFGIGFSINFPGGISGNVFC